ncbi:MAG: sigma-54-dependent transcriptional regulator [Pseudomonadales bacterium]
MSERSILVVEDDAALREALQETLVRAGYVVATAADGRQALDVLDLEPVGLVVSDVQMRPMDGLELLERLREGHPEIPVVLMTAYGSIRQAVEAMQRGAHDYLAKPFEGPTLIEMVRRYLPTHDSSAVVAADPRSVEVLDLARRLADNDLTVLISGESGTGKEVYARYIHAHSTRRDAPFIAINCAAIPENMLEAVLFGYEKGAFTGAHASHAGKFEQAQGGTLLLDEISEMGPALQAKLLRVLQEREVERLGGRRTIALDVRVLATTNRELRDEVREGRFREDLFYRLNVLPLCLPPLRERPGDVLPLVERTLSSQGGGVGLSEEARGRLLAYHWPGNVRELENLVQRAMVLAGGGRIEVAHLLFENEPHRVVSVDLPVSHQREVQTEEAAGIGSLEEDLKAREREIIFDALKSGGGSREAAASRLGISPRTLRHKLARLREEGVEIPGERLIRRSEAAGTA